MSNQPPRKSGSGATNAAPPRSGAAKTAPRPANGAAARPAAKTPPGTSAKPAPGSNGKVVVTPARSPRQRVSQPISKPKRRFAFRPLDMALIALGVIGVVALVWAVLSNNGGSGAASSDPRNRLATRTAIPLGVGVQAPDFTNLPSTDGGTYSLSQFRGKVVLLELMAPWCPHCQADAPIMEQIWQKYKDKGVQIIGVNATPFGKDYENGDDRLITMDDQKWFHDNFNLTFPLLFDKDMKVADDYGVTSFPTIYVIDPNGKIVARPDTPPITADTLSAALDTALKNAGVAAPAGQATQAPAQATATTGK